MKKISDLKNIHSAFKIIIISFLIVLTDGALIAQTNEVYELEYSAGARNLTINDNELNISFPLLLLYPTSTHSENLAFGPLSVEAKIDAPIAEGVHPLIVISHGTGGFHLGYLTIAQFLAEHGFIVAMPEHYKNNRNDNSLENTDENLIYRPKHISLAVDSLINDLQLSDHIQSENYSIIGHSMGGYTALAVAGGKPWNPSRERVEVSSDPRVNALVLLAPATEWYTPLGSLEDVKVPILMLTAEHDAPLPVGWHQNTADIVLNQISNNLIRFRVVENSGHFSFLSPFPEHMKSPDFLPSTDQEGFDRVQFHNELNQEIYTFLLD